MIPMTAECSFVKFSVYQPNNVFFFNWSSNILLFYAYVCTHLENTFIIAGTIVETTVFFTKSKIPSQMSPPLVFIFDWSSSICCCIAAISAADCKVNYFIDSAKSISITSNYGFLPKYLLQFFSASDRSHDQKWQNSYPFHSQVLTPPKLYLDLQHHTSPETIFYLKKQFFP